MKLWDSYEALCEACDEKKKICPVCERPKTWIDGMLCPEHRPGWEAFAATERAHRRSEYTRYVHYVNAEREKWGKIEALTVYETLRSRDP